MADISTTEAPQVVEEEKLCMPAPPSSPSEEAPGKRKHESPDVPEEKRARIACTLEEAAVRLSATANEVRKALAAKEAPPEQDDPVDLANNYHEAVQKLEELEARCQAERALLITAKANVRSMLAAQEEACLTVKKVEPIMSRMDSVAVDVAEVCQKTVEAVNVAVSMNSAMDLEEGLARLSEPSIAHCQEQLQKANAKVVELKKEQSEVELACKEAKDRLAELLEREDETKKREKELAAVSALREKAAVIGKEVESIEGEVALLQGASSRGELKDEEAAPGPDADGASQGEGSSSMKCLDFLAALVAKHRQASEEQTKSILNLEARCGPLNKEDQQPPALPQQQPAEEKEDQKAVPSLDLANPGPFVCARAAQRLIVCSKDASELAGEFKQVPGGANGWPAYKACGTNVAFLLWTPCDGGCWVFASELAAEKGVLARSLELAWTRLPDEIMATSWTRAAWGERGQQAHIVVLRG